VLGCAGAGLRTIGADLAAVAGGGVGRSTWRGAARGAELTRGGGNSCGMARGAATCGAARGAGAATCGIGAGAARGPGAGAACGTGAGAARGTGAGAACGAGAAPGAPARCPGWALAAVVSKAVQARSNPKLCNCMIWTPTSAKESTCECWLCFVALSRHLSREVARHRKLGSILGASRGDTRKRSPKQKARNGAQPTVLWALAPNALQTKIRPAYGPSLAQAQRVEQNPSAEILWQTAGSTPISAAVLSSI
jgi:hypothetical protein